MLNIPEGLELSEFPDLLDVKQRFETEKARLDTNPISVARDINSFLKSNHLKSLRSAIKCCDESFFRDSCPYWGTTLRVRVLFQYCHPDDRGANHPIWPVIKELTSIFQDPDTCLSKEDKKQSTDGPMESRVRILFSMISSTWSKMSEDEFAQFPNIARVRSNLVVAEAELEKNPEALMAKLRRFMRSSYIDDHLSEFQDQDIRFLRDSEAAKAGKSKKKKKKKNRKAKMAGVCPFFESELELSYLFKELEESHISHDWFWTWLSHFRVGEFINVNKISNLISKKDLKRIKGAKKDRVKKVIGAVVNNEDIMQNIVNDTSSNIPQMLNMLKTQRWFKESLKGYEDKIDSCMNEISQQNPEEIKSFMEKDLLQNNKIKDIFNGIPGGSI